MKIETKIKQLRETEVYIFRM